MYVVVSKPLRNHFISEKYKLYNHLSYISFNLCNYTLLPTTVKVLETFLEAILLMPFQLFRSILQVVSSVTTMLISVEGTGKNQMKPDQGSMEILQRCHTVLG
jgi:hypothetical protein